MSTLGQRLRWLIKTLEINQVTFARAADVKDATVCTWVRDNRRPHRSNIRRAIRHLNLPDPDSLTFIYEGDERCRASIVDSIRYRRERDDRKEIPSGRMCDLVVREVIVHAAGFIEDPKTYQKIVEHLRQQAHEHQNKKPESVRAIHSNS